MADHPSLILASESPRRRALLKQIGVVPDAILPANIDETARPHELPRPLVKRLAHEKARAIATQHKDSLILAADTIVACGRRILPKPKDENEAVSCLRLLSGRAHHVYTAICLIDQNNQHNERLVDTRVHIKRLSESEISAYLSSGEWQGKAGGYGIQGRAAMFVQSLNGSYSNVVGLPLFETSQLLKGCGYPVVEQVKLNAE